MTPENSTAVPELFLCDDCAKVHGYRPRTDITETIRQHQHYIREIARLTAENAELKAQLEQAHKNIFDGTTAAAKRMFKLESELATLKAKLAEAEAITKEAHNYLCSINPDNKRLNLVESVLNLIMLHNGLYSKLAEAERAYNELLYAVERKFLGETRHETALRYIRECEKQSQSGNDAAMNRI